VIEALLAKLRKRFQISAAQEQAIRDSMSEVRTFTADQVIIRAREQVSHSMLLIDGWMGRVRDLANRDRQITELHISGDFADLHSFTLRWLDHSVVTFSPCKIALFPHEQLKRLTEEHPALMRALWFTTNLDAAIHREWVVSLGRRNAPERLSHMFCELHARLEVVGLVRQDSFAFPLTQEELGECAGLTGVHVNRTLQDVRGRGLIRLEHRKLSILDLPGLRQLAAFDPAYLHLEPKPDL